MMKIRAGLLVDTTGAGQLQHHPMSDGGARSVAQNLNRVELKQNTRLPRIFYT